MSETEDFVEKMFEVLDKLTFGVDRNEKLRFIMWLTETSFRYNTTIDEILKRFKEAVKKSKEELK